MDNMDYIKIPDWENAQRVFKSVVLIPGVPDWHNDIYSAEVVKQARDEYLQTAQSWAIQHGNNIEDGVGIEWLAHEITEEPVKMPNGNILPAQSWVATGRVLNEEIWKAMQSGELTGLSIKSSAIVEDIMEKSRLHAKANKVIEAAKRKTQLEKSVELQKSVELIENNKDLLKLLDMLYSQMADGQSTQVEISQPVDSEIKNYDDYLNDELAAMQKGNMSADELYQCLTVMLFELPPRQTELLLKTFIEMAEVMASQPYQSGSASAAIEEGAADITPPPVQVEKSTIPPKAMEYLIEKEKRRQLAKETTPVEKAKSKEPTFEERVEVLAKSIQQEPAFRGQHLALCRVEARTRIKNGG
ncbi:XkdF-like putative serine protease domain-containing protein [Endozoicomonas sp. ALB032]|uniref:XkdF-like putative serine protease domain-containing protein n=1 Tax=Endozoicomonas sp. ALB032 TaxID=3403082 RepID=UPI003BB7B0BD